MVAAEKGRLEIVGTGFAGRSSDYAAPETISGNHSPKSDVYSLAVTLQAAVGGLFPQEAATDQPHQNSEGETTIKVAKAFGPAQAVLESALAVDPEYRSDVTALEEGLVGAATNFIKPAPITVPDGPIEQMAMGRVNPRAKSNSVIETDQMYWRPVWKLGGLVLVVLALLSAGTAWAVSSVRPQGVSTYVVERYEGRTIGEVRAIADSVSWILDEDQVRSDELPSGIIVTQWPSPGSRLAEGAMLVVEVASGPRLRLTPLVLGLSTEAASARLETKGFEVDLVQPLYDENVAPGEVIKLVIDGESALGGTLREPGTRAVLIVSGGPVPRTVPQLVGLDRENAEEALEELRLTIAQPVKLENSETVPAGTVMGQGVVPGSLVDRGSTVSLTVSAGPDRREVPDMRGLSVPEAERRLAELGLVLGAIDGAGQEVQGSEPPAGTMLPPGAAVFLWVPSQQ